MNINRHNYEEFFILYMDNELNSDDRRRVELFVRENPDLQAELDMLQQSRLVPEAVIFEGKQGLMKSMADCNINLHNYEQWLLLYIDDELSMEQEIAVENFVMANPAIKTELDILQKTQLKPEEHIIYFDKESLYRKEEKTRRVTMISWWRIAAAAVLILGIGIAGFFILSNKPGIPDSQLAQQEPVSQTPAIVPSKPDNGREQPALATTGITNNTGSPQVKESLPGNTEKLIVNRKTLPGVSLPVKNEVRPLTDEGNINKVIEPVPAIRNRTTEPDNRLIAANDLPTKDVLTDLKENNSSSFVTYTDATALKPMHAVQPDGSDNAEEPMFASEKKTKFRGLLRKITRTFEKTTNIKATDEEDRLLIGGLAIRL